MTTVISYYTTVKIEPLIYGTPEMSDGTSNNPNSYTLPGANLEMIRVDTVRESNEQMKGIEEYVAVFIGGMFSLRSLQHYTSLTMPFLTRYWWHR